MRKPRLIYDWRSAHRFWSVRVALGGLGAGFVGGAAVFDSIADHWPILIAIGLGILTCVAFIVARVLEQPPHIPQRRAPPDMDYYT